MAAAVGAFIPCYRGADIRYQGIHKIPAGFCVYIVEVLLVGAAADVVHIHHRLVDDDGAFIGIQANGAHIARHSAGCPNHIIGSHFHFRYADRIGHLGFVDSFVTPDKAQDQLALFRGKGHCLDAFKNGRL